MGFLHLCFDGDDLAALHDFDVAQGLTPTAIRKAAAGNLLFTLRGPEDQNIEYTQYLPGSLHFEDRGKHLGADRLANNFFAVVLGMKDPAAESAFYTGKLGFSMIAGDANRLSVPGAARKDEQIVLEPLTSSTARIFLLLADLKKTKAELKQRRIAFKSAKGEVAVVDPDGNALVFMKESKT